MQCTFDTVNWCKVVISHDLVVLSSNGLLPQTSRITGDMGCIGGRRGDAWFVQYQRLLECNPLVITHDVLVQSSNGLLLQISRITGDMGSTGGRWEDNWEVRYDR